MASRIYTRTGDAGDTGLVGGDRVPKDSVRVEAYGCVDEANSWVGVARAYVDDAALGAALEYVQHRFFNCSSNLATVPGSGFEPTKVTEEDVAFLEAAIDRYETATGALRSFVLPGGSKAAAYLHVARTVCRRAERSIVALKRTEPVDPLVLKFVNRSSDFLFAAARYANSLAGQPDVEWKHGAVPPMLG